MILKNRFPIIYLAINPNAPSNNNWPRKTYSYLLSLSHLTLISMNFTTEILFLLQGTIPDPIEGDMTCNTE